jgi:hypothetical protein
MSVKTKLMTKSDVEAFIYERTPHVRSVRIEEKPGEVIIKLEVSWLYWLFHRRMFHRYIDRQIQERKLKHLKYTVKIQ